MNSAEDLATNSCARNSGSTVEGKRTFTGNLLVEACEPGVVSISLQECTADRSINIRSSASGAGSRAERQLQGQRNIRSAEFRSGAGAATHLESANEAAAYGNAAMSGRTQLADVQEEVAKRISQRLHDESAQMLAVIYMELAEIAKELPEPAKRKVAGVAGHLDVLREQLRQLSHELRPLILDQLGLMAALQQLAAGVQKRSGLRVDVVGSVPASLSPNLEIALYRSVQEALSNVVRHACATEVEVTLWTGDKTVHCSVSDDGIGFQMPDGTGSTVNGLGLIGINERVVALDGDCKIVSRFGKGTELLVEIPL